MLLPHGRPGGRVHTVFAGRKSAELRFFGLRLSLTAAWWADRKAPTTVFMARRESPMIVVVRGRDGFADVGLLW